MQKVTVQIDWYTKVVLTLIAVLLAGLLVKPYIVTKPVNAMKFGNILSQFGEDTENETERFIAKMSPLPSDEYSKKARANKGEYSIVSVGEFGGIWVLEKYTGRLSLLTRTGPSNELEVINDGYLDEILKWDDN